ITCAIPGGNVSVTVDPVGQIVSLTDDGLGSDQAAGDGIYSGRWVPLSGGSYTLTFPGGDVVTVQALALATYTATPTTFNYRIITGTNLDLGDDSSAAITSPFPILFGGGGSFSTLFVGSNGNVNFSSSVFAIPSNAPLPPSQFAPLVAPRWDALVPVHLWTATMTVPPPTINVTPSSRSFGGVAAGSSEDLTFTVQNTGGGVVSGTATVGAPFLVISGGSYSLSAGQSQRVTVRFSP